MWKKLDEILRNRCWYSKSCQRGCLWKRHQRVPSSERAINSYAWRQLRIQWRHVLLTRLGWASSSRRWENFSFAIKFPPNNGNWMTFRRKFFSVVRMTLTPPSHNSLKLLAPSWQELQSMELHPTKSFLFLRREENSKKLHRVLDAATDNEWEGNRFDWKTFEDLSDEFGGRRAVKDSSLRWIEVIGYHAIGVSVEDVNDWSFSDALIKSSNESVKVERCQYHDDELLSSSAYSISKPPWYQCQQLMQRDSDLDWKVLLLHHSRQRFFLAIRKLIEAFVILLSANDPFELKSWSLHRSLWTFFLYFILALNGL